MNLFNTFQNILDKDLTANNPWFVRSTQKKLVRFAKTEMIPLRMPHCRRKATDDELFQFHSSTCKNYKTEQVFIFTPGIRKLARSDFYNKIDEKEQFVLDCIDSTDSSKIHTDPSHAAPQKTKSIIDTKDCQDKNVSRCKESHKFEINDSEDFDISYLMLKNNI